MERPATRRDTLERGVPSKKCSRRGSIVQLFYLVCAVIWLGIAFHKTIQKQQGYIYIPFALLLFFVRKGAVTFQIQTIIHYYTIIHNIN